MVEAYDEAYKRNCGLFGDGPEGILVRGVDHLDRDRVVLDVGCGQGRNALWLAGRGFDVVALDPSAQATRQVAETAGKQGLPVDVRQCGFTDYVPEKSIGGVCVFGLMQILSRNGVNDLVAVIDRWTSEDSIVFVTAWTVKDPRYATIADQWRRIGDGSFEHEDGRVRTFFGEGEILELFRSWQVVYHWEGLGPWHQHGDGPKERHGCVQMVARRAGPDGGC